MLPKGRAVCPWEVALAELRHGDVASSPITGNEVHAPSRFVIKNSPQLRMHCLSLVSQTNPDLARGFLTGHTDVDETIQVPDNMACSNEPFKIFTAIDISDSFVTFIVCVLCSQRQFPNELQCIATRVMNCKFYQVGGILALLLHVIFILTWMHSQKVAMLPP